MHRTVMLLLVALLCAAVATGTRLARRRAGEQRRVFRGTEVPYSPARQVRRGGRIQAAAAVLGATALVGAFWQPANRSSTPPPPPLPAASVLGPGVGITVDDAGGSGAKRCTAGFLVRGSAGRPGLLTAGHCNGPGGRGTAVINYSGSGRDETVGTVTESVYAGVAWDDDDIALISLDDNGTIPLTSNIVGGQAVTGVLATVVVGDQLCKFGIGTGRRECGRAVLVEGNKVAFSAPTMCGDSGGPVFVLQPDGSAAAVGVLVAGSNAESDPPGCAAPARYSVAELIAPWLNSWHLSAVTTPPASTSASVAPR